MYPKRKEEVKLSLYANNMVLSIENIKDSTQKSLEVRNERGRDKLGV